MILMGCCADETYEVTITGLETRAYTIEGNQFLDVSEQTPVNKEDLVISVSFDEDEILISNNSYQKRESKVDVFESAVVPCGDATFIYTNRLETIRVEVVDVDNANARIDITNQLRIVGTDQSLVDYISENKEWLRDFLIEFDDTTNIPNRIRYDIEVTLDDNSILNSSGGIINFN